MRRTINMFAPYELDFSDKIKLSDCYSALQQLSISERAKFVKTWLHGWATTHRIKGDHLHACMLGCAEGADSLSHYLNCPRVFGSISFFLARGPCGSCTALWPLRPFQADIEMACLHVLCLP